MMTINKTQSVQRSMNCVTFGFQNMGIDRECEQKEKFDAK